LAKKKYESKCDYLGEFYDPKNDTPDLYIKQADYDLRNIYNIIYLRNGLKNRDFFSEKYYFVTADSVLKTFVKENFPHTGQAYAIGDGTLAFLLYYKNPINTRGFSVQSFLNAHFDTKKLSIKNWYMYYENVTEKFKKNQISKSQAGYLLCKVILDNERFSVSDVDDIIANAIEEYKNQENMNKIALVEEEKRKEEYKSKYDDMTKSMSETTDKINALEQQIDNISRQNKNFETQSSVQSQEIKRQNTMIILILVLLGGLSIGLFFTNNPILGGITTAVTLIGSILEIVKKLKK
jgi:hypothetical protein